ncbi:MAG: hypothetical protein BM558_10025 [Roseobacter sp. MedPE-SW]|nr:MAG: hypothetical protein BM558_10025 [Roseobacter sp. MedPE-SW]
MIWRASLAQIDQDGAFSAFPGLRRIHCIISGDGLRLSNSGVQLTADLLKPLFFDGGLDLVAQLQDGPCEAFNLIYDPNRIRPKMQISAAGLHQLSNAAHLVFVLGGTLRLENPEGVEHLNQGEGWHGEFSGSAHISQDGRAILLHLEDL